MIRSTRHEDMQVVTAFLCGVGPWIGLAMMPAPHPNWPLHPALLAILVAGGVISGVGNWTSTGIGSVAVVMGYGAGGILSMLISGSLNDPLIGLFCCSIPIVPGVIAAPAALLTAAIFNAVPSPSTSNSGTDLDGRK